MKSGETGIRTPGKLPYTRYPSVHLQPLGHLSGLKMAAGKEYIAGRGRYSQEKEFL